MNWQITPESAIEEAMQLCRDTLTDSREKSLVVTKLEEAQLWLGKLSNQIKDE